MLHTLENLTPDVAGLAIARCFLCAITSFCQKYDWSPRSSKHLAAHQWKFLAAAALADTSLSPHSLQHLQSRFISDIYKSVIQENVNTLCSEKNTNTGKKLFRKNATFFLYVTQNKNIKYFWNCFGWTKGLQGTQNGCEMLKKTKISFSPTSGLTRVSWSPLLRPKQF